MRLILGIVIGAFLTIGIAYVHDSGLSGPAPDREARALVNWTVFNAQMRGLNENIAIGWNKLTEVLPRKG